jgi:hypothetical protein
VGPGAPAAESVPAGGIAPDAGARLAEHAAALARRAVRFGAGAPVPGVPPRPAGGQSDAEAAARAAAFLLSVSVSSSGPSLLAVSLGQDALAPTGADASPPVRAEYTAGAHRGGAVLLHGGLFVVEFVPHSKLHTTHPGAAAAGYAADTFCLLRLGAGAGEAPLLARSATLAQLDALLAAARGTESLLPREDAPAESARALALSGDTIMPALRHAVSVTMAHVATVAAAHGDARTERQLKLRAHGALLQQHMARSLAWNQPGFAPPALWRRAWYGAALVATGAKEASTRPPFSDARGIALAAGWEPRTKATSGYPFPRHECPPGHTPTVDVAAMHAAVERMWGPLDDNDPMWTVLGQAYNYRPQLNAAFHAELAAAAADGRPLTAPEVGRPPKPSAFSAEQTDARFAEVFASGVARLGTAAEAMRPNNYVAGCKFVTKAKAAVPASVTALEERYGGGAPPAAISQVAAAARGAAAEIIAEVERDVAGGEDAEAAVDAARARRTPKLSLRWCHNGRHLSSFMDTTSYVCATLANALAGAQPGDLLWCHDFTSFFYCVRIDPAWRHLYWQEYTAPDGTRTYLQSNTMTMGMADSSSLAQCISGVVSELAMFYGARSVAPYTDDLMCFASPAAAPASAAAVARAMDEIVPGGENVAKRSAPSAVATLIGHTVDMGGAMPRVFIALPRLYHYLLHLMVTEACLGHANVSIRQAVTTVSMGKLIGRLSFLCDFSGGGRPTLAALYAQLWSGTPPYCAHRSSVLAALSYWSTRALNGSLPVASLVSTDDALRLNVAGGGASDATPIASARPLVQQSDAGAPAGAAFLNGRVVYRRFTATERGYGSDWRELTTVLAGVRHFLPQLRGRVLLIVSDHGGNVANINKGTAGSRASRRMIQDLYRLADEHGFWFVAAWVPRECNEGPDKVAGCSTRAAAVAACAELGVALEG